MVEQRVTFTLDAKDYAGVYDVTGDAESAVVSVRFEANSISAFAGHLRSDVVARTLLGELVRAKLLEDGTARSARSATKAGGGSEPLHYRYSRPSRPVSTAARPAGRLVHRSSASTVSAPPLAQ